MIRVVSILIVFSMLISHSTIAAKRFDVGAVIAQRSGLPKTDIDDMLHHCDRDQQSMYFCSWRDVAVAQHKLDYNINRGEKRLQSAAQRLRQRLQICSRGEIRFVSAPQSKKPAADLTNRISELLVKQTSQISMPCILNSHLVVAEPSFIWID